MAQLLFYRQPEMLNRYRHRHLRMLPVDNAYGFARQTNSTVLTLAEFGIASRVYPILFASDATGKPVPVVLLGVRSDENLFVDADGRWDAPYVPAFVRRYPFVLAEDGGQWSVCIDRAYPGFFDDAGSELGAPLFGNDNEPLPALRGSIDFLEAFQRTFESAVAFAAELAAHDLLTEVHAVADVGEAGRFSLSGLLAVDEARLATLPAEVLQRWLTDGTMKAVMAHRLSLDLLPQLAQRLQQRLGATSASNGPAPEAVAASDANTDAAAANAVEA